MRRIAVCGLAVVCVCLVLALGGPSAQRTVSAGGSGGMSATASVGFVGVTTETFQTGVGALAASRACYAELPFTRLCERAEVLRSIPPPALDTDILIAENYEVNPRTTCITSDGDLKCKPGALLPAACCGSSIPSQSFGQTVLNLDTTTPGCSQDTELTDCSQTICVTAQAVDLNGNGIPGVALFFKLQNNVVGGNTLNGVFTPSQATTDSSGKVFAMFHPDSTCPAQCGGGNLCEADMIVTTLGGAFPSVPIHLLVFIP